MSLFTEPTASREELEAYIGKKSKDKYYTKVLDIYMKNPNKPVWCWPACLLNMFWLCYRKTTGIAILLVLVLLSIIVLPIQLAIPIGILVMIIMGLFGISIYLMSAEKQISRIKKYNEPFGKKKVLEALSKRGGVSYNYSLVLYIVLVILLFILINNLK